MAQPMTGPMPGRLDRLREAVRRPLPLGYHPLHRFYPGGSLTRAFRGMPERPDDWWSEDWVGSCTRAGNDDPDGRPQGMSPVEVPGIGPVTLGEIIAALPEEMVGARFAGRYGPITGLLRRHDNRSIRGTLHRTEVHPGEVYVAHPGVPHCLGPRISFIEVQEPSHHIVIPETDGTDDAGATMGLGWELALDMIGYTGAGAGPTFALPAGLPIRVRAGTEAVRVIRCLGPAVADREHAAA